MRILAALIALALGAGPAFAQATVPPQLAETAIGVWFERLAIAANATEAAVAEAEIQRIWLRSGSDTIDLLMRGALAAEEAGDLLLALDLLDGVTTLKPDYAEAWHRRAIVHFGMENYAASIADVERTLALEPRHFGALAGLGQIFYRLGYNDLALLALDKALAINPFLVGTRDLAEQLERGRHLDL